MAGREWSCSMPSNVHPRHRLWSNYAVDGGFDFKITCFKCESIPPQLAVPFNCPAKDMERMNVLLEAAHWMDLLNAGGGFWVWFSTLFKTSAICHHQVTTRTPGEQSWDLHFPHRALQWAKEVPISELAPKQDDHTLWNVHMIPSLLLSAADQGLKLREGSFRLDTRKKAFILRVVKHWLNKLPSAAVEAPVEVRLEGALSNLL